MKPRVEGTGAFLARGKPQGRNRRASAWVLGAAAALLCGCVEKQQTPRAVSDNRPGDWIVVGHRAPGVSAMSDAEAAAWRGRTIHLGTNEAVAGVDTCRRPAYQQVEAPADSFLAAEYHIRGTDLGLANSAHLRLRVTDVFCGEDRWAVMGSRVLGVSEDHGYAVWDGVFFELRPDGSDGRRKQ